MIPLSTHRISVERPADASAVDPWEPGAGQAPTTVAQHVRAVITVGGGRGAGVESETGEVVAYSVLADPCELTYLDVVVDEATGDRYPVVWVVHSPGLAGLASVRAGLATRKGLGQEATP